MTRGPKFKEDSTCPKCGSVEVLTHYQEDSLGYGCKKHCAHDFDRMTTDEHLHRLCERCKFVWREEVV